MQEPPPIDALFDALKRFAEDISKVLVDVDVDWHGYNREGEWSLTEVVCHLRDVELEVHQPRIEALIREEGVFLPGAVADAWVRERQYSRQHGPTALKQFLLAREGTLVLLSSLDPSLMQRQGQHAFFGPTTLHELLYLMVQHDDAHWEQISEVLAE